MASLLKKIFKKNSPISIKTKKGKDAAPIKIAVPKENAPAVKIAMPKAEERPAVAIKLPEEHHEPLKIELPEHHLSDAEALSKIVMQQPKPAQQAQAKTEKAPTIDDVVAALKKKPKPQKQEATVEKQRKKATRKTKHDKVIAAIASRSKPKPAKKQR